MPLRLSGPPPDQILAAVGCFRRLLPIHVLQGRCVFAPPPELSFGVRGRRPRVGDRGPPGLQGRRRAEDVAACLG